MQELPHHLNRTVVIKAKPETVFRYFTDSARWANWWGAGSTIDAQPGGKVYIRYPNGVETVGEVLEVREPERITFTYGYASGKPIPPGSSRVTIRLEPAASNGTRLHLTHEFAEPEVRDQHVQGWRYQLSVFANVVANEVYSGAAGAVDAWFRAWATADDKARDELLAKIVIPGVQFADRHSLIDSVADLSAHISGALRFMPGVRMQRKGDVRQCQGTVLADWVAFDADGKERVSGTNIFVLDADGRIGSATGFSNPAS